MALTFLFRTNNICASMDPMTGITDFFLPALVIVMLLCCDFLVRTAVMTFIKVGIFLCVSDIISSQENLRMSFTVRGRLSLVAVGSRT